MEEFDFIHWLFPLVTFNKKVQDAVKEACDVLEEVAESPAVQRAKAALREGAALLSERQKLIKIADRSPNGWNVVAEYTADELADDSDDEKRLEKAEKAAGRKARLKRRRKQPPMQKGAAERILCYPTAQGAYGGYALPLPSVFPQGQQPSGATQARQVGSWELGKGKHLVRVLPVARWGI